MKTYKEIDFPQISGLLMNAATGVSVVSGCNLVVSDMIHSLSAFSDKRWGGLEEPYFIAIREMGTESGYKEHCIDRCKGLGYPIVIAKIEESKNCGYDMTIMFTHGWMDRDNNYMEQEFNSL